MRLSADAWYSLISFRKRPIGLIVVAHSKEWGRVELIELEGQHIHAAALQFIRSTVGALRKRLERADVPLKRDLDYLSQKLGGEVRVSAPLPINGPTADDIVKRLRRGYLEAS